MFDPTLVIQLQIPIDWILDYEPAWLGPAIVLLGVLIFIFGYAFHYSLWPLRLWIWAGGLAMFMILPWAVSYNTVFAALLTSLGSWFGGVGAVRLLLKIRWLGGKARVKLGSLASSRKMSNGSGGSLLNTVTKKFILIFSFQLLTLLGILLSIWIVLFLSAYGETTIATLSNDIIILWTLVTLVTSLSGILWRFWSIEDTLPFSIMAGLVLMIAGSEVYNLQLAQSEIALFFISKAVFMFGYIGTGALWLTHKTVKEDPTRSTGEIFT
jgi:hypothetical protein